MNLIGKTFNDRRRKNKADAYLHLQQQLVENMGTLVPDFVSLKDMVGLLTDIEDYLKQEGDSSTGHPMEIMAKFLQGENVTIELPAGTKLM